MNNGRLARAVDEARHTPAERRDLHRIARRHGVDERLLEQRLRRSATFERALEVNRTEKPLAGASPTKHPRRRSGEKHRTLLRFLVGGAVLKLYRREFFRGELKPLTHHEGRQRQCLCGRDLVMHGVPVASEVHRPSVLCECGAVYEAQ